MALITYVKDFLYGSTKYPCALFKPKVYFGYFTENQKDKFHHTFYSDLQKLGFKKTAWQLVFPGQSAGLVKRINYENYEANEIHIRFFRDGVIDCEFEVTRWSLQHWSGERLRGEEVALIMEQLVGEIADFSDVDIQKIKSCFTEKPYTASCIRV